MRKRRDWTKAREKVDSEGGLCRVCKSPRADAAHVIPRSLAPGASNNMSEDNIVPLCRACHTAYDQHILDLLPYLRISEQVEAVRTAGGIGLAYRRVSNIRDLP